MTAAETEFAELHGELSAVARDVLASAPRDEAVDWGLITRSGWTGLEVAEAHDGAGATFAEVAVILREIGRAASRGAYPAVAGISVGALRALEPGRRRDEILEGTASGAVIPVLVLAGDQPSTGGFQLIDTPQGRALQGAAGFVLDAAQADRLLVPAVDPDGAMAIVDLDPHAAGLLVAEQPVVDETRMVSRVVADGVAVPTDCVHVFNGNPEHAIARLRARAAVAIACDSLGLSEAMLDATVAYAGVREQFGRPIGSFQAVKHACADMLVQITIGRTLVAAAVQALVDPAADATVPASMAKAFTGGMAVDIAGKAMQLHGGMGYTWESGIHVYLKRATLNRVLFGSPATHRKILAQRY